METCFEPREEFLKLAMALEKQMRYNEGRGKGDAWAVSKPSYLIRKLEEEVEELGNEIVMEPDFDEPKVQHESLDVICVAFFIWFNSTQRERNKE